MGKKRMSEAEVSMLLYTIHAVYPAHFTRFTERDMEDQIAAWRGVLEDYSYIQASAGLKAFLASDTKGFPPVPGQVIDFIRRAMEPEAEQATNPELIALIRRALANSGYNSEAEFDRLPEICQRAVGTPHNLEEWCRLDNREVETVILSHVARALDATRIRMREDAKIPTSVRRVLGIALRHESIALQHRERQEALPDKAQQTPKENRLEVAAEMEARMQEYKSKYLRAGSVAG